ncbi:MAG: Acetyl-CoA decarbonylase/synthase complex subunit delta 1 [Methanosaeta sp. PtaU1.Bin060]|jgi:CO dehydrogenase/acetyl-CoA synthase delta subunit|nr:MAG: Acetyl-CoA decarbonylase/synthase complex subunit delta 1 [Methanosaeta sp. PtaU1.Bin060]
MADEKSSLKMKNINEELSDYKVQSLEGVVLEGDIEIEMDISSGAHPLLAQSLGQEFTKLALQLYNFSKAMGYPVDSMLQTAKASVVSSDK